jgi:hypothetical protein
MCTVQSVVAPEVGDSSISKLFVGMPGAWTSHDKPPYCRNDLTVSMFQVGGLDRLDLLALLYDFIWFPIFQIQETPETDRERERGVLSLAGAIFKACRDQCNVLLIFVGLIAHF